MTIAMRAAAVVDGRLEIVERPAPNVAARQVRVQVRAAGINRADVLQREGRYTDRRDDLPGLEFCGIIDRLGSAVTRWQVGDRVMGLADGAAHADLVVVPEDAVAAVPDNMSDVDAGCVPEAFVTSHDALVTQAGLASGETVLVHAVGSGVGTAAVQLVAALGARPVGTSRTPEKLRRAVGLGMADGAVVSDPLDPDVLEQLRRLGPPDVVLDLVGGRYVNLDLSIAARKGRIVVVGLLAGTKAEADLRELLTKRLVVRGSVLRTRPPHEKAAAMDAFARQVLPLLADGRLGPAIERIMPFERANEAYDLVESDETFGKVALTW